MESQRVVVVVEEVAAARAALQWAVHNFIRAGDCITLLHVCPPARSRRRRRSLRLGGFQLALAFKELCNGIAEAKVEIVVREGEVGETVVATVNQLTATTLVVGLHDKSFLYKSTSPYERMRRLGCRVLGIRQHATARDGSFNAELTQIETINLHVPPPKIPFPMFTLPLGVLWGRKSKAKKRK
uniref:UspA domain-containing protein n=1 Tax=Leersia perrieri TaxID=77586 RepID=A0A0D9UVY7_9ORYZ